MEKLIQFAIAIIAITASAGQLPRLIREVRVAQSHLIQDSKASNWGLPMLLKK